MAKKKKTLPIFAINRGHQDPGTHQDQRSVELGSHPLAQRKQDHEDRQLAAVTSHFSERLRLVLLQPPAAFQKCQTIFLVLMSFIFFFSGQTVPIEELLMVTLTVR